MPHPPSPQPTPETQWWWDALAEHRFELPHCTDCGQVFHPPSAICPHCASTALDHIEASGHATLYSYVIHHRPLRLWGTEGPRSVALVQLTPSARTLLGVQQVFLSLAAQQAVVVQMPPTSGRVETLQDCLWACLTCHK